MAKIVVTVALIRNAIINDTNIRRIIFYAVVIYNSVDKAEISNYKPMKGQKALFLSVHGGGCSRDPISGLPVSLGTMLCYIVPIKQSSELEQCIEVPVYHSKLYRLFVDLFVS